MNPSVVNFHKKVVTKCKVHTLFYGTLLCTILWVVFQLKFWNHNEDQTVIVVFLCKVENGTWKNQNTHLEQPTQIGCLLHNLYVCVSKVYFSYEWTFNQMSTGSVATTFITGNCPYHHWCSCYFLLISEKSFILWIVNMIFDDEFHCYENHLCHFLETMSSSFEEKAVDQFTCEQVIRPRWWKLMYELLFQWIYQAQLQKSFQLLCPSN